MGEWGVEMELEVDDLKKIYENTEGWLKFIEAKLMAMLTIETGLGYFIFKSKIFEDSATVFQIFFILIIIVAVGILISKICPSYNDKRINPLYFYSWVNNDNFGSISSTDYEEQIKDLALVIMRKSNGLRLSIFLYCISFIPLLVGLIK